MTNGPSATIGEILQIDLERPRKRVELAGDARYNHFRHEVLAFLYERQRKVEDFSEQKKSREAAPSTKVRVAL
jgi:nitrate/nitrite transport system ATP-binding protein